MGLGGISRRVRPPGIESLFVGAFALLGFRLGARPIGDNSAFVHLRTGIDMVRGLGIPRVDPYSFTAHGEAWVVQSWFAEWTYGLFHRVGDFDAVVVQHALLGGLLGWLVARLARAGTGVRTLLSAGIAVGLGILYWSPRPLLFGLLCLALTVTVVERRLSPWWLLPVVWVWANSHGSFVLGVAYLLAASAGEAIDGRRLQTQRLRYLPWFCAGLVVAAVNPLGPRLLLFPFTIAEKASVFRHVVEWQAPAFTGTGGTWTLLLLVAALVVVSRSRPTWSQLLPVWLFLGMALVAQRNIPMLAVVVAPALGRALASAQPTDVAGDRRPVHWVFASVLALAAVVMAIGTAGGPALDVEGYPISAAAWLEDRGLLGPRARVVHQDITGGYLVLRDGRGGRVFVDDRVDMYPVEVTNDYRQLLLSEPGAVATLDQYQPTAVLWEDDRPLVELLNATGRWREAYRRDGWVVLLPA